MDIRIKQVRSHWVCDRGPFHIGLVHGGIIMGIFVGLCGSLGQHTLVGIVVGLMWGLGQHTLLGIVVGLCGPSDNTLYSVLLLVYGGLGDTLHWVLLLAYVGPRATHLTGY
jgi:hypothetical protein